jgi:NhaC family Na+:H+ antiporter
LQILLAIIVCFVLLILSTLKGIFIAYPLGISLCIFIFLGVRQGYSFKEVLNMAFNGGKKAFIVLKIFILIGAITSAWMASGTVPAIVYYGIRLLNPKLFILSAFLISCMVSFLIGTSFGTVGTVGIALMVMSKGSRISPEIAAGAIIAGAYFGDRCSPMSSSANLIANLTGTDLYENIKNMFKTSAVPFIVSIAIYLVVSFLHPLQAGESSILKNITSYFNVNVVVLLPAVIILILSAFKVDVKISMLISILTACVLSVLLQHESIVNVLKYIILGFNMDGNNPLSTIIKGGGILSMLKLAVVVFISSAFSGVFEGTGLMKSIEKHLYRGKGRGSAFIANIVVSIATAAFGCTQTIAIILGHELIKNLYQKRNIGRSELAVDIENAAVLISPLIPWNIAGLVPATSLMSGSGYIFYAFYLYLVPLFHLIYLKIYESNCNNIV